MKIISKHRDYYDSIQSYGGYDKDEKLIYLRNQVDVTHYKFYEKLILKPYSSFDSYFRIREFRSFQNDCYIEPKILGFCGKLYPFIKIEHNPYTSHPVEYFIYNINDMDEIITSLDIKDLFDEYYDTGERKRWYLRAYRARKYYEDVFSLTSSDLNPFINEWVKIFSNYKTPAFLMHYKGDNQLVINPSLKDYQFYKIKNPFEAFQEISMYLSGVLGMAGENPIPLNVSDKDMLGKKGFDDKSFKTESPGKKFKRRNK